MHAPLPRSCHSPLFFSSHSGMLLRTLEEVVGMAGDDTNRAACLFVPGLFHLRPSFCFTPLSPCLFCFHTFVQDRCDNYLYSGGFNLFGLSYVFSARSRRLLRSDILSNQKHIISTLKRNNGKMAPRLGVRRFTLTWIRLADAFYPKRLTRESFTKGLVS